MLRTRRDIACVLVNPLQALHPNAGAPADSSLVDSSRRAHFDKDAYADWLRQLRAVCTERNIVLIFDEVFVGFRLAVGGAQEYFGVRADLVTYGKTLGGGLPIGVVCGRKDLMSGSATSARPTSALPAARSTRIPTSWRRCTSSCSISRRRRRARSIATSIRSGTSGRGS